MKDPYIQRMLYMWRFFFWPSIYANLYHMLDPGSNKTVIWGGNDPGSIIMEPF